jgi:putative cardiolipin synthase
MISIIRYTLLTIALALGTGCASIDFDYPRAESFAYSDTEDTFLGRQLADDVAGQPAGQSGFYTLADGIDSLAIRLLLAHRAERSIDLQYYLIKDGITGRALIGTLLQAADRGVRVRLLVDDMFTSGYDDRIAALDSHPNFEIRIFNPFNRGFAGRARSGITGFSRINRRMHNKSFTVDNQVTVVGGRNIADEYFGAREDAKFSDLDVLGVGPVVQDVSTMFDTFWNHETAIPVPAFIDIPDDVSEELQRVRRELSAFRDEVEASPYADALQRQVLKFDASTSGALEWAPYELVYDSPDKGIKRRSETAQSIMTPLVESIRSAEKELIVISPYLVPRKSGVEGFKRLRDRDVNVTIVTNSLAANNQFAVHGGYAPSRKPLLEQGVSIYEARPDAEVVGAELIAADSATATLHTKAFIVDERELFIGSFNFDPRSAYINTESGVIIRSPALSGRMADAIDAALASYTYEVFLNEDGKLRWRETQEGEDVIWKHEPKTTWFQRFIAGFMRIMPIRGQL